MADIKLLPRPNARTRIEYRMGAAEAALPPLRALLSLPLNLSKRIPASSTAWNIPMGTPLTITGVSRASRRSLKPRLPETRDARKPITRKKTSRFS